MKRLLSRRPSPALVVAVTALFVSMGGVSYAVATGSVDSRAIKDASVRGQDLRANTITQREVKRRSLDGTDIMVERVGGNAVKEQVLESEKIGKVREAAAADTVGGKTAAQLDTRWALIDESGKIARQTGGFAIVDCYQTNANCYIDAGEDVRAKGIFAEIAVNNTDGSPFFSGDTGVAPCGEAFVACAPPNTERESVLVVTPRASDGTVPGGATPPAPADAARFYVFVTGSAAP